jgi:predicted DNA-binding antitoxin AbrB/MazE fold protein
MGIKEGEKVRIHIEPEEKYTKVKDLFGTFHFKRSTAEIMKEVDEELDSEL